MSSGIVRFEELGRALHAAWKRDNFDSEGFPLLAAQALREFALESDWSLTDLILGILERNAPHQSYPFSDLALRVYETQEFYIEVLVWLDGTTTIHEHSFSGAFRLLAGQSIHSRFAFQPTHRISRRFCFGRAAFLDAELLNTADVREIRAGATSMHSLFHLQRPSITLVVRTRGEPWSAPQMMVCRPACALDHSLPKDPTVQFASRSLKALANRPDELPASLAQLLRVLDTPRAFAVCLTEIEGRPLLQNAGIYEVLEERFTERFAEVKASLELHSALLRYMQMRQIMHSVDDRFVLALVATVPSREKIRALAAARFGAEEGLRRIARMLGAIMERDGFRFGIGETDALESIQLTLDEWPRCSQPTDLQNKVLDHLYGNALTREFLAMRAPFEKVAGSR